MHNRLRRAGYALAAGVAVTAALSLPAVSASAGTHPGKHGAVVNATTACGAACVDVSFVSPGPTAILGVNKGLALPNNTVRLLPGSNGAAKEDFSQVNIGPVVPVYCTATGQAQTGSVFTNNQCNLLIVSGMAAFTTFQLAFNPNNGGPETMCIGAFNNKAPRSGFKIRLEPCGVAADTVIIAAKALPGGIVSAPADFWLINGASDNFSNPLVATDTGAIPSNLTWSTVRINAGKGIDTQEITAAPGPF